MVCFTIKDQKDLDYFINYKSISPDPENFRRCVARERWQEIDYYSKKGEAVFWNSDKRIFTDTDFKEVKINKQLIPRCMDASDFPKLAEDANKLNIKLINTPYEFHSIENWMSILPQKYLNRRLIVTTKESASKDFKHYYNLVKDDNGRFFIKSVVKGWSYSGSPEGWYETGMVMSLEHGSEKDLVMFSKYIDIEEDDYGTIEYRCFIINGQVRSISRYLDYDIVVPTQDAADFIVDFVDKTVGFYFPKNVVLDIMQSKDGNWHLVEANAIPYAGRYVGNIVETFDI